MATSEGFKDQEYLDISNKLVTVFPNHTTCALLGTSLAGKSTYLKFILQHIDLLFECVDVSAVYIVYCDVKSNFYYPLENFEENTDCDNFSCITVNNKIVYQTYLSDFDPDTLTTKSILIFEDVSDFHSIIKSCIHFYTHHFKLAATFIVCQTLAGRLAELSLLVQKIIFFTRSKSVAKEFKIIINKFFSSDLYRQYLIKIYQFVESTNDKLLLSLFSQYTKTSLYLAISHLELINLGGAKAYLGPNQEDTDFEYLNKMSLEEGFLEKYSDETAVNGPFPDLVPGQKWNNSTSVEVPTNTLVLMPIKYLNFAKEDQQKNKHCLNSKDEVEWNNVLASLTSNIQAIFDYKDRAMAEFLMREICLNPEFCITSNKMIHLNEKPSEQVSMIDFIKFCRRTKAPYEQLHSNQMIFKDMKRALVRNGTPENAFKNALLRL